MHDSLVHFHDSFNLPIICFLLLYTTNFRQSGNHSQELTKMTNQFCFLVFFAMMLIYAQMVLTASLSKYEGFSCLLYREKNAYRFPLLHSGKLEENNLLSNRDENTKSSSFCGKQPGIICLIYCATDPSCEVLGFNRTEVSCGCPCQKCKNEKVYGATNNHTKANPLTPVERNKCLDITHPCSK